MKHQVLYRLSYLGFKVELQTCLSDRALTVYDMNSHILLEKRGTYVAKQRYLKWYMQKNMLRLSVRQQLQYVTGTVLYIMSS